MDIDEALGVLQGQLDNRPGRYLSLTQIEALSTLLQAHERARAEAARLRDALEMSPDDVGRIMHETWSRTKRAQGFHNEQETCGWCKPVHPIGDVADSYPCRNLHRDLIPWDALPEGQKDFNRHAFEDVFAEMRRRAALAPQAKAGQEGWD